MKGKTFKEAKEFLSESRMFEQSEIKKIMRTLGCVSLFTIVSSCELNNIKLTEDDRKELSRQFINS